MDYFIDSKKEGNSTPSQSDGEDSTDMNYNSTTHSVSKVRGIGLKIQRSVDNVVFVPDNTSKECENKKSGPLQVFNRNHQETYDPHDFGNTDSPTSFWGTVIHVIMISAGPAILSIPFACVGVGYVAALVTIPLIVFLYVYDMHMVIWSEHEICKMKRVPNVTYPEAVYHAFQLGPCCLRWFAPCGKILSYLIFIMIWFFGCSYSYIIIVQNSQIFCHRVFDYFVDTDTLMSWFILPFLLLCWVRKLNYLVPLSFIGNVFNWFTFILIIYFIVVDPSPWNFPEPFGELNSIFLLVGTVIFVVNATGIIIPLKNEMKHPKKFSKRGGVLQASYIPVSVLYTCFSLICYLKYGSNLQESVIDNLPKGNVLAQVGVLLSTLALIFQYPLIMYVCVDVIWNNILKETRKTMQNQVFWEYALRTMLVLLSFVVSFADPNILLLFSLGGTVGSSIDSIILPACMQTLVAGRVYKSKCKFLWTLLKNMMIISLALVLVVGGVLDCVKQIKTL